MIHLVYSLGIRTHDHKSPPITTAPLWLLLFRVFEFASRSNKKIYPILSLYVALCPVQRELFT